MNTPMPRIVALSGKAGSGKDFCSHHVFRPLGYMPWAFAWALKHQCVGHGAAYDDVFADQKAPHVRALLQRVGTEEGRDIIGANLWIDITAAWLRTLHTRWGIPRVVITDLRFQNEYDWVKAMGGKVVRMEYGLRRPYVLAGTPAAQHRSETELDLVPQWDAVITNSWDTTATQMHIQLAGAGVLDTFSPHSQ